MDSSKCQAMTHYTDQSRFTRVTKDTKWLVPVRLRAWPMDSMTHCRHLVKVGFNVSDVDLLNNTHIAVDAILTSTTQEITQPPTRPSSTSTTTTTTTITTTRTRSRTPRPPPTTIRATNDVTKVCCYIVCIIVLFSRTN